MELKSRKRTNPKRMKKLLQFVTVLAISLFAGQPGFAALACSARTAASVPCAPRCPMAMHHLGAECLGHESAAGSRCDQEFCRHGVAPAVMRLASGTRRTALNTGFVASLPPTTANASVASPPPLPDPPVSGAPARYILFRVFRI
jgi:hypothetical protein